jgi:tetratricopeptide (TPR) repeat protein
VAGRPLVHAEEPRLAALDRWLRRRRPAIAAAAVFLAAGVSAAWFVDRAVQGSQRDQARAKWAAVLDGSRPGVFRFTQPGDRWDDPDRDDVAEAWRHLALYGVTGSEDWRRRGDVVNLPGRDREDLEVWLAEQAWRVARAVLERAEWAGDAGRALRAVERVGGPAPPSPLAAQDHALRQRLGISEPRSVLPPPDRAWLESYLLALEAEPRREALTLYRRVLVERPGCFWAEYRASAVAYRLGDYQAAVDHLARCVARRPQSAPLRVQLAGCSALLGRFDDALAECDRAVALDPAPAEIYRNRAFAHAGLGRRADVEADLLRFQGLTAGRGRLPSLLLRFDLAAVAPGGLFSSVEREGWARQVLARDSERAGVRVQLAWQLHLQGRTCEAIAELEAAVAGQPGHLPARFLLADLLRWSGREDEAGRLCAALVEDPGFEELVDRNPRAVRAYHMAAVSSARRGRPDLATEYLRRGYTRAGDSAPDLRARFRDALAGEPGLESPVP